ncbi:phosphotransferase [Tsukamurella paurometabola]|uniref:Phosphotransferase n=1 Tax=Tsukamurella paurometabola TaxID=2061 RepID=A0A3P8L941_TSUPA|nr:phosphotransferase [Tsukamurella paurometabola]MBS4103456.1 phosphotransferase [Tsukamurella paurometabola]UEA83444.1 phosphotransferase [Tsukamurella paurometabola]VDR40561.1 Phosphotransferase enzyme family [Tsukamurella paurometabola]
MLTPPDRPTAADVLAAVRDAWSMEVTAAVHLPLGFGAHHWRVDGAAGAAAFATVDLDTEIRPLELTAAAYRSAARLQADGVPGVVAPVPAADGRYLVPLGPDGLSLTPWLDGRTPSEDEARAAAERTVGLLLELHAATPPAGIPRWSTRVPADLATRAGRMTAKPWDQGPYGEAARAAVASRLDAIGDWVVRHAALVARAGTGAGWVPTHGEPHHANQMLIGDELVFVDWESLRLAPPERDLLDVPAPLRPAFGARDWAVELFALEWRLTEIAEYLDGFSGPHGDGPDEVAAYRGLLEELGLTP